MLSIEGQFQNTPRSNRFSVDGKIISSNFSQLPNASSLIVVTPSGISVIARGK